MEALKGFIFDRGKVTAEGKEVNSYLVCFHLLTDDVITNLNSETVIMGSREIENLTVEFNNIRKYKPPYHLGDASRAIKTVCKLNPEELEEIK